MYMLVLSRTRVITEDTGCAQSKHDGQPIILYNVDIN